MVTNAEQMNRKKNGNRAKDEAKGKEKRHSLQASGRTTNYLFSGH